LKVLLQEGKWANLHSSTCVLINFKLISKALISENTSGRSFPLPWSFVLSSFRRDVVSTENARSTIHSASDS
jgi:hypothetical protein